MKVLMVTHSFPPEYGGIEQVAWEQARGLAAKGHEVHVVTALREKGAENEMREGVSIARVPCLEPLRGLGVPYVLADPKMSAAIQEHAQWSDAVIAHGHPYLSTFLAARAAKKQGKPFFLVQHNTFIRYPFPLELLERLNDATIGHHNLSAAKNVICVSRETEQYVKRVCPTAKTMVLYNGVDTQRFMPAENKKAVCKSLGLPSDAFIVFTARRLAYKNGIDLLLDAATQLRGQGSILFVVAGTGPDEKKVQALLRSEKIEGMRLLGFVAAEKLPAYYQAADAFVLPSRSGEGFPLAVLEAMASGLPVVATRSGGQREVVQDGENGFLVEAATKPLAEAIKRLAEDPRLVKRLAQAARQKLEGKFGWEQNINGLEAILVSALR